MIGKLFQKQFEQCPLFAIESFYFVEYIAEKSHDHFSEAGSNFRTINHLSIY